MKRAIVIGSGAGGAMAAKELQGNFEVTILEAGRPFKPLMLDLNKMEPLRKAGLMFDERLIQILFPSMKVVKTADKMALVYGTCTGGTTTLATGNALRYDGDLAALGINLDSEFEALKAEVPQTTEHRKNWSALTEQLFKVFDDLGMAPQPLPKMLYADNCVGCGHCVLGCAHGAKWDSRQLLEDAVKKGAHLLCGCRVERISIEEGHARGVVYRERGREKTLEADLIILAAGGLGSPLILENSGILCEPRLFVDPVLCVAAPYPAAGLDKQLPMPFAAQRDGYILSPYFDLLSFYFNKKWRLPSGDMISIMIKLADSCHGSNSAAGIDKELSESDKDTLKRAVDDCHDILAALGVDKSKTFLGTLNAGHPGGMLPLTRGDAATMRPKSLPENLYLADATLFPESLGNPPILTIMALAKKIAKTASSVHPATQVGHVRVESLKPS